MAAVASPVNPPLSRPGSSASVRRPSGPSESKESDKVAGATNNVVDVSAQETEENKAGDGDKSPKEEPGSPKNPQRPSIRPVGQMPSKFDQEVNPFEQSFRASSHHGSTSSLSDRERSAKRNSPTRGGDETSTKHNALPPLSSLTSPAAADPSQFPWLASHSLRTGPLSPAMLAGPQGQGGNGSRAGENGNGDHQAFDPSQFRTGFTPGTGSGFTPGYNSLMNGNNFSNLPLPSPNTAAFLNMVTNATPGGEGEQGEQAGDDQRQQQQQQYAGQQQQPPSHPSSLPPHMQHQPMNPYSQQGDQQDTITPGTFSALTGAIHDMNRANGHHPHNQPPPHQQHQQPPPPGQHGGMPPGSYYNMNGPAPHHQMHGGMPPHPPHIDYAQQSANAASQAANGLFLLSQAHQELSKREEEGRGSTPSQKGRAPSSSGPNSNPASGIVPTSAKGQQQQQQQQQQQPHASGSNPPATLASAPLSAVGGTKRKSDAGAAGMNGPGSTTGPPAKGAKKGKKAATAKAAMAEPSPMKKDESTSPSFSGMGDMSMDMDDDDGGSGSGKFETEEDKRKNFLERNRQAALKCRQRKKAWLTELQHKVDSLSTENEALQRTIGGLHDEVGRLTALLMQRDGGMGVPQPYGRPIR